ncbi:MAG: methyltransferase [Clostridiales Family XIII bacterium]|jgi:hypothetical protein|nr:methyltransferase [Clostridiales Family XIII bacterium]
MFHSEDQITPIDNFKRAIEGKPLWTPTWFELQDFSPRILPDARARGFVLEAHSIDNDTEAGGPDMFGVEWEWVPQVGGSMVRAEAPQYLPDISKWEGIVKFPDPDSFDWAGSAAENAVFLDPDKVTMIWVFSGFFERLISFMGFENAAIALVDDEQKPYVHAIFDRLCTLYTAFFARFKKYYDADMVYFHDDWGGQYAPFFSVDTVHEMLLPYLRRVAASAHAEGLIFNFHSCGKIECFVPLMVEAGVDIWSGQMINDMPAILKEHAGELLVVINPGLSFDQTYTEEEIAAKTALFLEAYDDYLDAVVFQDFLPTDLAHQRIYQYSREKFAG